MHQYEWIIYSISHAFFCQVEYEKDCKREAAELFCTVKKLGLSVDVAVLLLLLVKT